MRKTENVYTITASGDAFCVVTQSNKGKRGWVFSHVAGDPQSDYEVYRPVHSVKWDDEQVPEQAGVGGGDHVGTFTITDAVDEQLQETFTMAVSLSSTVERDATAETVGVRKGYDAKAILFRALLDAKNYGI